MIEATDVLTEMDGVPVRLWKGTTEAGVACKVFVHAIAVASTADTAAFDRELEQIPPPRSFPLRAVLGLLLLSGLLSGPSGVARADCPAGRCAPPPRYVHPVYASPSSTPRGGPAADEPGYLPGTPMPTPAVPGSGPGAKCWVWLRRQGVWGFGWQIQDGPHRGLWRVDPGSKRRPSPPQDRPTATPARPDVPTAAPTPGSPSGAPGHYYGLSSQPAPSAGSAQVAPTDHRQAFLIWLNGHRAQHGLGPVGYSEDLEWAALANSRAQAAAGRSGHYGPATCWQVSFLGPANIEEAIRGWVASPSHAAALLEPSVTMIGVGVIGASWSVNLR